MRLGIHPFVFLIGSLLICAAWLSLRPVPSTPATPGKTSSVRSAMPARVRETIEVPPAVLQRYVGTYQIDASIDVTIELDAGHLFAQAPGTPRYALHATSARTFFTQEIDSDIEFKVDAAGRAKSFDARFATGTITAERVR